MSAAPSSFSLPGYVGGRPLQFGPSTHAPRSGVPRSSLYITTKLDRLPAGTTVRDALVESLKKLRVDHVDQFLVHMPVDHPDLKQTWKDMEAVHAEGLTKAIGVSNFQPKHLDVILDGAKVTPAVNQVRTLITFIFYLRLIINPP